MARPETINQQPSPTIKTVADVLNLIRSADDFETLKLQANKILIELETKGNK